MFGKKMINEQIEALGVRIQDTCCISPLHGYKKVVTLSRQVMDFIPSQYRPEGLAMSFIELPYYANEPFHYRLEIDPTIDEGRYFLRTIKGAPFWINGLAAREAYVERSDRLLLEDNKISFKAKNLQEISNIDHTVLDNVNLMQSELNILIQGETGTGKTHLARKIHEKSNRPGPFVGINLSSFNSNLIESELFGHKKGAFTGAVNDKQGAFSEAAFGTLFLDEVDSLPLELQTKLLTFLDSKKFRPVGSLSEQLIQTRLIFASGRRLEDLVRREIFRKDFYYRLKSGHTIELLPLRNDVKKIRETCEFFAKENGLSCSKRMVDFYETLAWPGNIRQLFGHLEKKKVFTKNLKLDFDNLDEELLLQSSDLMSFEEAFQIISLEECKLNYVKKVVSLCEGNIAVAARKLRINEKTVRTLMGKC